MSGDFNVNFTRTISRITTQNKFNLKMDNEKIVSAT